MAISAKSKARNKSVGVLAEHAKNSPAFYAEVLRGIGAPVTAQNLRVLDAWQRAEGSTSSWNPFNSTQSSRQAGETNYNSIGVKNYPSEDAGIKATVATLKNGYYGPMITALKNNNQEAFIAAVVASPWDDGYGGRGSGKTYKNSSVYRLFIQGGGPTLTTTKGANPAPTTTPARPAAQTTAGPQVPKPFKPGQNAGELPGLNPGAGATGGLNLNPFSGFDKIATILTNGPFWIRILEMFFGALIVAWGVSVLTTGTIGLDKLSSAAKLATL
jgi:hypothetical protein